MLHFTHSSTTTHIILDKTLIAVVEYIGAMWLAKIDDSLCSKYLHTLYQLLFRTSLDHPRGLVCEGEWFSPVW